jgi:hypothetical protein
MTYQNQYPDYVAERRPNIIAFFMGALDQSFRK